MSFQLGKFSGIQLTIHWSFSALLLGIITVVGFMQGAETGILYGLGIISLFVSVILHEFMHSYVASRFGYETDEIVLYPLGGMSKIEELPTDPKQEFLIAFMGPFTNFLIAGFTWIVLQLLGSIDLTILGQTISSMLGFYISMNLVLGLFNLLVPAIPMDGGRLLRSVLATQMPFPEATRRAVQISKIIALLMALIGFVANSWLLIIAFFVFIASSSELEESLTRYILEDIKVGSIPISPVKRVRSDLPLSDLLDKMLKEGNDGYLVEKGGNDVGVITLTDIRGTSPGERNNIAVSDLMRTSITTISVDDNAIKVLKLLKEDDTNLIFVREGLNIEGQIERSDLLNFVRIKSIKVGNNRVERIPSNISPNISRT